MPTPPPPAPCTALRSGWLLAALAAAAAAPVGAAVTFVDQHHPAADDSGPGSDDRPFKTLGRAVRPLAAGDTVLIRTGTYRESIVVAASGEPDRPIVIAADAGAHVTLSGADLLRDAPFANAAGRDFRLPVDHPAHRNGCYPRGDVPGVRLGTIDP